MCRARRLRVQHVFPGKALAKVFPLIAPQSGSGDRGRAPMAQAARVINPFLLDGTRFQPQFRLTRPTFEKIPSSTAHAHCKTNSELNCALLYIDPKSERSASYMRSFGYSSGNKYMWTRLYPTDSWGRAMMPSATNTFASASKACVGSDCSSSRAQLNNTRRVS